MNRIPKKAKFDILTLFPEVIDNYLNSSMLKKAQEEEIIEYHCHNIRDFAIDEYGHVDDTLYGGGNGMLMRPEPLYQAHQNALDPSAKSISIYLSPKGKIFNQDMAKELAKYEQLILICGHYEGIDQRFIDKYVNLELSIGDFVISGGELAALVVVDATSRMLPGFLASDEAMEDESHFNGLLEARQYTRPAKWQGIEVPAVLRSGNHGAIAKFRYLDSLNETLEKRPDLFSTLKLGEKDLIDLAEYRKSHTK